MSRIENYSKAIADKDHLWVVHHRIEDLMFGATVKNLISRGAYFHRPAHELIFMSRVEHRKHHFSDIWKFSTDESRRKAGAKLRGRKHSDESRRKMSESHKGKQAGERNPMFGRKHSDESRRKMSESHKGKQAGVLNPRYNHNLDEHISEIETLYAKGVPVNTLAKKFNVSWSTLKRRLPNDPDNNPGNQNPGGEGGM